MPDPDPVLDMPVSSRLTDALVADLVLEHWRLGRRVSRMGADFPEEALAPLRDSLRRFADVLDEHGVEIRPHDGERYVEGAQFEVIHVRDDGEERWVVETVRPTVLLAGRILRHGQVIVGQLEAERE